MKVHCRLLSSSGTSCKYLISVVIPQPFPVYQIPFSRWIGFPACTWKMKRTTRSVDSFMVPHRVVPVEVKLSNKVNIHDKNSHHQLYMPKIVSDNPPHNWVNIQIGKKLDKKALQFGFFLTLSVKLTVENHFSLSCLDLIWNATLQLNPLFTDWQPQFLI